MFSERGSEHQPTPHPRKENSLEAEAAKLLILLAFLVGAAGFELATPCTPFNTRRVRTSSLGTVLSLTFLCKTTACVSSAAVDAPPESEASR